MGTMSLPINEAIEFEKENLIIDVDLKSKELKEQLANIKEKLINLGTESFMHYYCERPKPNPYSDKIKYVTNDIVQDYIKGLYKESEEETVNKVYKKYNNKIYKV